VSIPHEGVVLIEARIEVLSIQAFEAFVVSSTGRLARKAKVHRPWVIVNAGGPKHTATGRDGILF
jgi:hypothetical protein